MTEHARAEEADMINFNSFLWSDHWMNDYRPASETPDGHAGEGDHGTTETTATATSEVVVDPVVVVDEQTGETH
jgi:hypothetical protein